MRYSPRNPDEMVPLTPAVFHILLSLADGERHGYSIMRDIAAHTKGKLRLGPATLYRSIKHLVEDGPSRSRMYGLIPLSMMNAATIIV